MALIQRYSVHENKIERDIEFLKLSLDLFLIGTGFRLNAGQEFTGFLNDRSQCYTWNCFERIFEDEGIYVLALPGNDLLASPGKK